LLRFQQQRLHLLSQIERLEEKGGNTTLIAQYKSDGVSLTERVTQICEALFALWRTRMFAYFRWEHSSLLQKLPVLPSFTELEGEAVYKKSYVELVDFTHEIRRVLEGVQQKSLFPPEHLKIPQYIQDEVQEEKESTISILQELLKKADDICDQLLYVQDWFTSQKIDKEARNIASLNSTKEAIHSSLSDLNSLLEEEVTLSFLKAEEEAAAQLLELKSISSDMGDKIRADREVEEALRHLSKRRVAKKKAHRVG